MKRKYYGIVEGFFSKPLEQWTSKERENTLMFIQKYAPNINTYFYCPKDDEYVTKKWNLLYPQDKEKRLKIFIQRCKKNNINFIYGFNPLIEDNTDWEDILLKVIKKINQLVSIGCKNVCLLFDDIPIAYDVIDNKLKSTNFYSNLILCINRTFERYKNTLEDFWVCLPDYNFTSASPLTKAAKSLDENIGVIWSGNKIFSKTATTSDVARVKQILFPNLRLIFWSNYPVNDAEQEIGTFNLGGLYPIEIKAFNQLAGFVINPMREVYSNLPFYITFSDFLQNSRIYKRSKSWESALKKLGLREKQKLTLTYFSSPNIIDKVKQAPENFYFKESNLFLNKDNVWGNKFIKAINQVFMDSLSYQNISRIILENKRINKKMFKKLDRFPTKMYVSRYFPEILSIAKKRYSIYSEYYKDNNIFITEYKLLKYFEDKFQGQNKLNISKQESRSLLDAINKIVARERKLFVDFLQNSKIPTKEKILLFNKRKNINRFT